MTGLVEGDVAVRLKRPACDALAEAERALVVGVSLAVSSPLGAAAWASRFAFWIRWVAVSLDCHVEGSMDRFVNWGRSVS